MKFYKYIFLLLPLFSFGQTEVVDSIAKTKITHESQHPVHSILLYVENLNNGKIYNKAFGKLDQNLQKVSKND